MLNDDGTVAGKLPGIFGWGGATLERYLAQRDVLQNWYHDRELQISYLSQSAQLEEALKPGLVSATLMATCGFAALFVLWAGFAKIDEVTRAPGEVSLVGAQQTLQHPDGGVVQRILTSEGDLVEAGQALLILSSPGLMEDKTRAAQKQVALLLQQMRFRNYLDGTTPDFNGVPGVSAAQVAEQQQIFASMATAQGSDHEVIANQVQQKKDDLHILSSSLATQRKRLAIAQEGYKNREALSKQGYFPPLKLLEMKDEMVGLRGQVDELQNKLVQGQAALAEFEGKLASLDAGYREDVHKQLEQTTLDLAENTEFIKKIAEREKNLTVRAPLRGVVKGLMVTTIGGVVLPGQPMMDLVPSDKPLLVEVRVVPQDIGNLKVGELVRVKVSAYDFSRYGEVEGRLQGLSASTFVGENGMRYYKARVQLDHAYVGKTAGRYPVTLGMTVMADVVTGKRTVLGYLLRPLETAFQLAFKEH